MNTITLTPFEILTAANVGVSRNVSALRDGRPLEQGREDAGWERHIDGAISECAVAKMLGAYWQPAVGRLDTQVGDVAGLHVKSTKRADGCLIVREHDPDQFTYVLCILELPCVHVVGCIAGNLAKLPRYWREQDRARGIHRAAFFVPQSELSAIRDLAAAA